ncbi:self-protective colicin-like immunity [Mucilaginibacter gossypiicola]|uniref:Self-protective colicin-like immunity n=1 Tax=Mucilaginibacter gossypiicola TaxID=551995 RepID=A0A1H8TBK8_9SPHI|nr:colicin immunity domain-containing protein [Mucilaginibacter gossypiicola]SEO88126.1 self-protective colicin-like immunity [Mucilaginibacter gossypiicola]
MKLTDKIHLEKYIELITQFLNKQISAKDFETRFLSERREDKYWMSGLFNKDVGQILDTLFLDIDEFTPDELYAENDLYAINEAELRSRTAFIFTKLEKYI